jgi:hypothetical protein
MATTKNARYPAREGPPSIRSRTLHYEDSNGDGFRLPANMFASLFEKNMAPIIGGGINDDYATSLTVPGWGATVGGTGDATAGATSQGGGLLITCPSDDDFNMGLESTMTVTPTSAKWYSMACRLQISDAVGIGFRIGLGNSQALPFTTDYTDFVGLSKAILSADVYGRVRGNSGTAAQSAAALGTMVAATEIEIGMAFYLHATAQEGYFSYKTATADAPTFTAMTSAQLTALATILTTPPTSYWIIHATGVTGTTPTITITSFLAGGDR